ncbi:MAG TPA: MFS transporter [Thermomicrobiaceae bacterium]|nr:MFS transporter [Thermomicrobiaceae bacterium]
MTDRISSAAASPDEPAAVAPESTSFAPTPRRIIRRRVTLSTFDALHVRPFRWFLVSSVIGTLGYQMQAVALGWLVYVLTGSAVNLGLVTSAQAICEMAASPFGGVIADRIERRNYIMAVRSLTVITAAALAVLLIIHRITYPELVVGAAVFGIAFGLNGPARQALMAQLVGNDLLVNAVSLNSGGMNLVRIVGPAAAGFLIGVIGVPGIYVLLVVCYVIVIAALIPVPPQPFSPPARTRNPLNDLGEGISYSYRHPAVFGLLMLGTLPLFFAMPYVALLPVFAVGIWHSGATGFGILSAAPGIGGFVGALVVASLGRFQSKGRLMLAAVVGYGAFLSAFALSPNLPVASVFLALVGLSGVAYSATVSGLVQLIIPNEMRGRVMSFYQMSFGISGLSALPASAIAAAAGAPITIAGCGVLVIIAAVAIFRLRPVLASL